MTATHHCEPPTAAEGRVWDGPVTEHDAPWWVCGLCGRHWAFDSCDGHRWSVSHKVWFPIPSDDPIITPLYESDEDKAFWEGAQAEFDRRRIAAAQADIDAFAKHGFGNHLVVPKSEDVRRSIVCLLIADLMTPTEGHQMMRRHLLATIEAAEEMSRS